MSHTIEKLTNKLLEEKLSVFHEQYAQYTAFRRTTIASEINQKNLQGQGRANKMAKTVEKEIAVDWFRGFFDLKGDKIKGIRDILLSHFESFPDQLSAQFIQSFHSQLKQGWDRHIAQKKVQRKAMCQSWGARYAENQGALIEQEYRSLFNNEWKLIEVSLKEMLVKRDVDKRKQTITETRLKDQELQGKLQMFFEEYFKYAAQTKEAFRQEHADVMDAGFWRAQYRELFEWHLKELFHGYSVVNKVLSKAIAKCGLVELLKNYFADYPEKLSHDSVSDISIYLHHLLKRTAIDSAKYSFDSLSIVGGEGAQLEPLVDKFVALCEREVNSVIGQLKESIKCLTGQEQMTISTNSFKNKDLPVVVILTAILEEYNAVKAHLHNIVEINNDDTYYDSGIFSFDNNDIANVIISECGAKNTNAAQETERAIRYFKPDCIFFVGIAGSRKPNDFNVGDVIFPHKIYSYEAGKAEKNDFKSRPDVVHPTQTLSNLAKNERKKEEWKKLIKTNWERDFKADLGIIASGEQLIEHNDSEIGRILTKHYNDTSAVEMEGYGFVKAVTNQGRNNRSILYGVVRGISDIIQQNDLNSNDSTGDKRPSHAKKMASDTAAAFTYWLIYKLYWA